MVSGDPEPDRSGRTELAPHVIPGKYIREAVISSTGSSMRWFKDYVDSDLSDPETHESAHDYPGLIAQAARFHLAPAGCSSTRISKVRRCRGSTPRPQECSSE